MCPEVFDTDSTSVQMIMVLQLQKLQRDLLPSLRYYDLETYLNKELWVGGAPSSLHRAAADILAIDAAQVVRFLSRQAVVDGVNSKLEDYSDIIGGN